MREKPIGNSLHRLEKSIENTLRLRKISLSHSENSGDFVEKLKDMNMKNRLIPWLDIKS